MNVPVQAPPHNIEAERAILGSCLIDRDLVVRLAATLEPNDFYVSSHVVMWQTMLDLFHAKTPVDVVTVTGHIEQHYASRYGEDAGYLVDLLASVPTAVHGGYYAGMVRGLAMRRRLIELASENVGMAYGGDVAVTDVIAHLERGLAKIAHRLNASELVHISDVTKRLHGTLGAGRKEPTILTGVTSLDNMTMGFAPGQLIVIAARPGFGKSMLGLQIAYLAAKSGVRTAIANAEMTGDDTVLRLASRITGVTKQEALDTGIDQRDMERMTDAFGPLSDLPLYLLDCWHQSLPLTLGTLRSAHASEPFGLIVVDYIGLFQMPGDKRSSQNRVQEVTLISRALKSLALELQIPVVALSQLSRAVEHRSGGRPMLSDLRESGSIEQDADMVIFMHRPDKSDAKVESGRLELLVAKHRGGSTGIVLAESVDHRFTIKNPPSYWTLENGS